MKIVSFGRIGNAIDKTVQYLPWILESCRRFQKSDNLAQCKPIKEFFLTLFSTRPHFCIRRRFNISETCKRADSAAQGAPLWHAGGTAPLTGRGAFLAGSHNPPPGEGTAEHVDSVARGPLPGRRRELPRLLSPAALGKCQAAGCPRLRFQGGTTTSRRVLVRPGDAARPAPWDSPARQ